jgi:hypothetical protein
MRNFITKYANKKKTEVRIKKTEFKGYEHEKIELAKTISDANG